MINRFAMSFFRWWIGQLVSLIPPRILQVFARACDAAILELDADHYDLTIRRDGFVTSVSGGDVKALSHALRSFTNVQQLFLLRIPARQVLRKKLSLPKAVRSDLKAVLAFEIDRETPFEQSEVYWNYAILGQDAAQNKIDVELVLVPRRTADAAIEVASRAGFEPSALQLDLEEGDATLIWLATQRRWRWLQSQRKQMSLAMAAAGLALLAVLMPFAVQQWQFFVADREIAATEPQAQAAAVLRRSANRRLAAIAFLGPAQSVHSSALAIVADVTKVLPDNTFLTSLNLHDGRVTMTGLSESAASLISLLADSHTFRQPTFDAAVLGSEDDDFERFTISVALDSTDVP